MRFAVRCIICLAILYAAILRHDGYLIDPGRLAEAARAAPQQAGASIAAAAGPPIAARLAAFCRHDAVACIADPAMITRQRIRGALGMGSP